MGKLRERLAQTLSKVIVRESHLCLPLDQAGQSPTYIKYGSVTKTREEDNLMNVDGSLDSEQRLAWTR